MGKHGKKIVVSLGFLVVLSVILLAWFMRYSTTPQFCNSCHIMRPYYASWLASNHGKKGVGCIDCHYEPGFKGTIRAKFIGFAQLTNYVTATYSTKPAAEISDESCLSCHEDEIVDDNLEFRKGIAFSHKHHLSGLRRGKKLRCTSCHSQIVQGRHITVSESTCFVCHFKAAEGGISEKEQVQLARMTECTNCHSHEVIGPDTPHDHGRFIREGVDCRQCHFNIVRGQGQVSDVSCQACHAITVETMESLASQVASYHVSEKERKCIDCHEAGGLHKLHVEKRKVECFDCHESIAHRLETPEQIISPACSVCHQQEHDAQKRLFVGMTEEKDIPGVSRRIHGHMACAGCHRRESDAPPEDGKTVIPRSDVCVSCHGKAYQGLLENWNREFSRRAGNIRKAVHTLGTDVEQVSDVRTVVDIRSELSEIAEANGIHNIPIVENSFFRWETALARIAKQTGKLDELSPYLLASQSDEVRTKHCLSACHAEGLSDDTVLEKGSIAAKGVTLPHGLKNKKGELVFSHKKHVVEQGLSCSDCHYFEEHGSIRKEAYDCQSCHHQSERVCTSCHSDTYEFYTGKLAVLGQDGEADVMADEEVSCVDCHAESNKTVRVPEYSVCEDCHDETYNTDASARMQTIDSRLNKMLERYEPSPQAPDAQATVAKLETLRNLRPVHNPDWAEAILDELEKE